MSKLFFDDWESLYRALIVTVLAYFALIILIRMSGKRTLAKMNAYDFLVTIALGSCLASVALNKNIALAEGALVFFTLIFLQFLLTWSAVRSEKIQELIGGQPTLLFYNGQMLKHAMKKERITVEELLVSARANGFTDLQDIAAVVLETTGDITVIGKIQTKGKKPDTLKNVTGFPDLSNKE